jgi:hypothetical protein
VRGGTILIASASIGGLAYAAFAFARAGKAIDEAWAFGDLPMLPKLAAPDDYSRGGEQALGPSAAVGSHCHSHHDSGGL